MEIMFLVSTLLFIVLGVILTYQAIKYGKTMWKFKNRKKDGSEDDDFKYFD